MRRPRRHMSLNPCTCKQTAWNYNWLDPSNIYYDKAARAASTNVHTAPPYVNTPVYLQRRKDCMFWQKIDPAPLEDGDPRVEKREADVLRLYWPFGGGATMIAFDF